jgi:multicomponent Na+:H+ antiporter subunit E
MKPKAPSYRKRLSGGLRRIIAFAFLWWVLTGGHPEAFWYGVPLVTLAALVSITIHPFRSPRWRVKGFLRFLPFFLWQSLQGGFDVARRVFHPRLPISPSFQTYSLRLTDESACLLLAGTISLLPGTLSAEMEGDRVEVHVLDDRQPVLRRIQDVEDRVASLYGMNRTAGRETPGGKKFP